MCLIGIFKSFTFNVITKRRDIDIFLCLIKFSTSCLFINAIFVTNIYFLEYSFNSFIISFINFKIFFLVVSLEITINILSYENLVRTGYMPPKNYTLLYSLYRKSKMKVNPRINQRRKHLTDRRTKLRITFEFISETKQAKRECCEIFKVLRKNITA